LTLVNGICGKNSANSDERLRHSILSKLLKL